MTTSKQWITLLARAGYASRGIVYLIIGCFTILAAIGAGNKKDSKGALRVVLDQPFGDVLLAIVIIGLVGYILWRLVQSLLDTDDHGWSPRGLMVRAGLLASAFTYATLAVFSASLLGVLPESVSGGSSGGLASAISGLVGKRYTSLGLGIIFLGVAIAHWWKAALHKYATHFKATQRQMVFIHPVAVLGLVSRGIVFALVSLLLFNRSFNVDSKSGSTPDLKDALEYVQSLPMGQWLLFGMGIGLILFSVYSLAESVWRRINVEDAGLANQV
ncbi:MAG: DUF1206 domain-containing protein [Hyphomicrobiales bacterium]